MCRVAAVVVASVAVCLTGCGSSGNRAHLTNREQVMNACGDLRARIEGLANQYGIRDPQPATLRGDATALRLRPATREALSSLAESTGELDRLHAPQRVIESISEGVEGYDVFERHLVGDQSRSERSNLKLQSDFTSIGLRAAAGCVHSERRGPPTSQAE